MGKSGLERNYMTETNKIFLDTNILIYFVDNNDKQKQEIAQTIIQNATINQNIIISTQCLQEFYNATTKKMFCTPIKAKEYVNLFAQLFNIVQIDTNVIQQAIDISIKNKLSFWDSLILSSAKQSGCIIVYSEDLNNGQLINGVKIINPFKEVVKKINF